VRLASERSYGRECPPGAYTQQRFLHYRGVVADALGHGLGPRSARRGSLARASSGERRSANANCVSLVRSRADGTGTNDNEP